MKEKLDRMFYLANLRKFTETEYREFDALMKEINQSWSGCKYCPGQIAFGQKILLGKVNEMQSQLPSEITAVDEIIDVEPNIETPLEIPVGKIKVTSNCSRCKKKKEALNKTPRTKG